MIAGRLPTAFALAVLFTGSALAADQERLERRGYQVLWEGEASIITCVHGKDRYQLGSFLFICDQFTADMPHHIGAVVLMGKPSASRAFLCFGEGDDCIEGTVSLR